MKKYYILNWKTGQILCKPKKGTGISLTRRYRQSVDDIDKDLEILVTTKGRAEQELKFLQDYVGPVQAKDWEISDEMFPF